MDKSNIINTEEAAQLLGCKPGTIRQNHLKNMIEGVHYFRFNPRRLCFYRDKLEHWFENTEQDHLAWLEVQAKKK